MRNAAHLVFMFVIVIGLAGCSPSPPSEDKIKSDLVGQVFSIRFDGSLRYQINNAGEIKGFRVIRRMTDSQAGTDTILVAVNIEDVTHRASGDLRISYRRYDQGWLIDAVQPASDFSWSLRGKDAK